MQGKLKLSYVLTLCSALILAVAMPLIASAEVIEEWVDRYNGPTEGEDSAYAIALDASGNVYVTGESYGPGTYGDYATAKYTPDGTRLWIRGYNGPGNNSDEASAIAVDALGNVYVTGYSQGSGTLDDYATIKYDTNGNQLWVQRYNGPGNDDDRANAIAIDPSGNVYVTGYSQGSGILDDYATIKYDINGNELWIKRYNGPADGYDYAYAIAIDSLGNVYVTGTSEGSGTATDYATVKYDTNGNQLWVARYNGPGNGADLAHAMVVDSLGNVYITGWSYGSGTPWDYATVKYDTNGNQLWVARYDGPGNDYDAARAIAIDSSGNAYVTGESRDSGTSYDYATVKYDTDGNQLWVQRYNGPGNSSDSANAIAIDISGNVCVTGHSCSGTDYWTSSDYATVKYDTNGNQLWVQRYDGPGNGEDIATAMVVDESGNVYVTGASLGMGTDYDYATVKYGEGAKLELLGGWSMISLSVRPEVSTVTALFPEAIVVYKYQRGMGYVQVQAGENLEVGIGYWILLDNPQSYVIRGTAITEYTIPVGDGWYMIGGCSFPAQQKMVTSGSIDVIYGYTQGKGYTRLLGSQLLERGKGYWILFSDTSGGAEFTASTSVSE